MDHLMPADVLSLQTLTDAQLSPDGAWIAFTVSDAFRDKTRRFKSQIWLVPAEGGAARQFTHGPRADLCPRWSPDGQQLAFLSDRVEDGRMQLYLMARDGGEAQLVTEIKGSLEGFAWAPDGRTLALQVEDPESEEVRQRREQRDDPIEYEKHHRYTRVHILDLATRTAQAITGEAQIWEMAWAPDGQALALVASDEPYEWSWYEAYLASVPVTGGALSVLARPAPRQLSSPVWSPDSTQIAYLSCAWSDRGAVGGDVYVLSAQGGAATNLTIDYRGSVRYAEWTDNGALLAVASEDARTTLLALTVGGQLTRLWNGAVGWSERFQPKFSATRDGRRIAVVAEDLEHPREIWLGEREGAQYTWRQLTHFNPQVAQWHLGAVSEMRWDTHDGLSMHGFLITPPEHVAGQRHPLITIVHGGPTSLFDYRFSVQVMWGWAQLLATRGYAIFLPNPRGSLGWGTGFAEANLGDMGGQDMQDVLSGVDACIANGVADAERLGVCGWSYGGFASAVLITQTTRFKAAIVGAGITNWVSFHGVSELSTWDQQFYLESPYEAQGAYQRFSPIMGVTRVRTPTLFLHGEQDGVVPVGQAYEMFRALKELRIPTELVVYPREGHGIAEKAHRLHVLNAPLDWFARHLPSGG